MGSKNTHAHECVAHLGMRSLEGMNYCQRPKQEAGSTFLHWHAKRVYVFLSGGQATQLTGYAPRYRQTGSVRQGVVCYTADGQAQQVRVVLSLHTQLTLIYVSSGSWKK